jgi:hypothetical protein
LHPPWTQDWTQHDLSTAAGQIEVMGANSRKPLMPFTYIQNQIPTSMRLPKNFGI